MNERDSDAVAAQLVAKGYSMASDPLKADFHSTATRKSLSQLEAYWSKKLFTGKGTPPPEANQSDVKAQVASGSNVIGYVDESMVDGSVKVLLKL